MVGVLEGMVIRMRRNPVVQMRLKNIRKVVTDVYWSRRGVFGDILFSNVMYPNATWYSIQADDNAMRKITVFVFHFQQILFIFCKLFEIFLCYFLFCFYSFSCFLDFISSFFLPLVRQVSGNLF